jgi:uncharacterized repeat protein (TIGR01451 family)
MTKNRFGDPLRALLAGSAALAFTVLAMLLLSATDQDVLAEEGNPDQADVTIGMAITRPVPFGPVEPRQPVHSISEPPISLVPAANGNLVITLVAPTVITNGDYITYDLTLINNSGSVLAETLVVDVLPKVEGKYVLRDVTCTSNCYKEYEEAIIREPLGGTVLVRETRQVSWTVTNLSPGAPVVLQLAGRVIGQANGTTFGNVAYAYSAQVGAATSNEIQTTVSVPPRADGAPSLSAAPTWLSADLGGTMGLDWGDFDHDGDLDLALGSTVGTTVYRNNQGKLDVFWQNDKFTLGVCWADVNDDRELELIAVGESVGNTAATTGTNYIYHYTGGSFAEWDTFVSEYQLVRVEAGDFTNDGQVDLAVSTNSINARYPVRIYRGIGGLFYDYDEEWPAYPWYTYRAASANISAVDYDNDDDLDLIVGRFPDQIRLLVNYGYNDPWDPFWSYVDIPGLSFLPYDFAWGDYDLDGDLDLAAAFPLERKARVYRNERSTNQFVVVQEFRTTLFRTPLDVEWADFDGNGYLDLTIADAPPKVYLNRGGTLNTAPAPLLETSAVQGQIWSMGGGDHDNDHDVDLALGNRDGASMLYTTFSSFLNDTLANTVSMAASSVAWGNADDDKGIDIIYAGSLGVLSENARLYTNINGTFSLDEAFDFSGFGPRRVAFGDVDRDGDMDIALSTLAVVRIYVNWAGDVWTNYDLGTSGYDIGDIAWADADSDGDLDLFVARNGPNALYLNDDGTMEGSPHWLSSESDNSTSIAWGDSDGDLHLDIAVANAGRGNRIYRNNQDNTFSLFWSSPYNSNSQSVAWGDYDGDGDLDLAVGNDGQPNLIWENIDGAFGTTPAWESEASNNTTSVAWGDWDNDGDLDLAVGNRGQPDRVYENTGALPLRWAWRSAQPYQTTDVAWGDKDGDGDLDLAMSQDGGGVSGIYENTYVYPSHLHGGTGPLPNNPSYLSIERPGSTNTAYSYSSAEILASSEHPTVEVRYTVYDAEDDYIADTRYWFSLNGGGSWRTATPAAAPTTATQAYATGRELSFLWNAQTDEAIGDNAVFRIEIVHGSALGPVQNASTSAVSPPFRLQATTCSWPEEPSITFTPPHPQPGDVVHFEGHIKPGTGSDQITFRWDFGDGTSDQGQAVEHIYSGNGTFNVRLEVTSAPCPVVKTLAVIRQITVGTGVPGIYLPVVLRAESGQ